MALDADLSLGGALEISLGGGDLDTELGDGRLIPGPAGADGKDGADGISPTVTVTEIDGGHRVTVTDVNGTQYFDVMDGAGGTGTGGADGEDGFSPVVTVAEITGGHRISITDAYSTQTFDVMDGADGAAGSDGAAGADGEDGVSCTHEWNGTVLTVTSASGSSSADLKGEKGDKGDPAELDGEALAALGNPSNHYVWAEVDWVLVSGSAATVSKSWSAISSWEYSEEIELSEEGSVQLVNPSTLSDSCTSSTAANFLPGKYVNSSGAIWHITAASGKTSLSLTYSVCSAKKQQTGEYSDSAEQDKYSSDDGYELLGKLGTALAERVRIATGSYTGTGTSGGGTTAKTNALSFDFAPKLVVVMLQYSSPFMAVFVRPSTYGMSIGTTENANPLSVTWTETGLSWYSSDTAADQLNASGRTYRYIAIG